MTLEQPISCPVCHKVYSRADHLTRHLSSHNSSRPYLCPSCGKAYRRRDVLRRHQTKCQKQDLDRSVILEQKQRRRACDECVFKKRACDNRQPCASCKARDTICSYPWTTVGDGVSSPSRRHSLTWQATDEDRPWKCVGVDVGDGAASFPTCAYSVLASGSNHSGSPVVHSPMIPSSLSTPLAVYLRDPDRDPIQSFEFLLRFTNPTIFGISAKFNGWVKTIEPKSLTSCLGYNTQSFCRQLSNSRITKCSGFLASGLSSNPILDSQVAGREIWSSDSLEFYNMSTSTYPGVPSKSSMFTAFLPLDACDEAQLDFSSQLDVCMDPLALKSHEILTGIRDVAIARIGCLRATCLEWSATLERICIQFFHPVQLRRHLDHFWTYWYPHWVAIHQPSFNAIEAPPSLVAAMAVIGACTSPDEGDREGVQCWRNYVEEMVFVETPQSQNFSTSDVTLSNDEVMSQLRSLQAAFVVCLYQTWEGSSIDAERIRQQRYGTIVTMARGLMPYTKHEELGKATRDTFLWCRFVLTEQVIRTIIYVFLVDSYFVIFHSLPPKMSIRELKMDLASPEQCFQAQDADSCLRYLRPWTSLPLCGEGLIFYGAIKYLRKRDMDDRIFLHLARAGDLNLWVLCSALHNLIFNFEPAFGHASQFVALDNAVTNWRRVWNCYLDQQPADAPVSDYTDQEPSQPQTRPGLMKYAPEWWLLARHILQRMKSCQADLEASEDLSGPGSWRSNLGPSIIQGIDTADTGELYGFICRCPSLASTG